jgi:predicted ribosome quality control (RQC) complex YloA/Tae2 family protein
VDSQEKIEVATSAMSNITAPHVRMLTETKKLQGLDQPVTFYIGKSQHENHDVLDMAKPRDYWFHVNSISSAHVVAVVPDATPRKHLKYIVKQGALLCKQHTAKVAKLRDVIITFTRAENVRKTEVLGEVSLTAESSLITI